MTSSEKILPEQSNFTRLTDEKPTELVWPETLFFSIREGSKNNEAVIKAEVIDGKYHATLIIDEDSIGYSVAQLVDVADFLKSVSAFLKLANLYATDATTTEGSPPNAPPRSESF